MKRASGSAGDIPSKTKFERKVTNTMKIKKLLQLERRQTAFGEKGNTHVWTSEGSILSLGMPLKFQPVFDAGSFFNITKFNNINNRIFMTDYSSMIEIPPFQINEMDEDTINRWLQPTVSTTNEVQAGVIPVGSRTSIRGEVKTIDESKTTTNSFFSAIRIDSNTMTHGSMKVKFWRDSSHLIQNLKIGDMIIARNLMVEMYLDNIYFNSMADTAIEFGDEEQAYSGQVEGVSFVENDFGVVMDGLFYETTEQVLLEIFPLRKFIPNVLINGLRTHSHIKMASLIQPQEYQPEQAAQPQPEQAAQPQPEQAAQPQPEQAAQPQPEQAQSPEQDQPQPMQLSTLGKQKRRR